MAASSSWTASITACSHPRSALPSKPASAPSSSSTSRKHKFLGVDITAHPCPPCSAAKQKNPRGSRATVVIICTFEDRATDIIGLKLLICGLSCHMGDVPVRVVCPVADDEFRSWLKNHPQVTLTDDPQLRGMGWNVKPTLLKQLLEQTRDTVVWMDSDIIVTRDFRDHLPSNDALVVTHEPALTPYGVRQRTAGWKFPLGRTLLGVNTCVVRAKPAHAGLITAWQKLLQDPDYRAAQATPFAHR